jgi:hypothetical protein
MRVCAQAAGIARLKGAPADADTLGPLVWAKLPALPGCPAAWWPGEVLDPFHLPHGRTLPPHACAGARSPPLPPGLC